MLWIDLEPSKIIYLFIQMYALSSDIKCLHLFHSWQKAAQHLWDTYEFPWAASFCWQKNDYVCVYFFGEVEDAEWRSFDGYLKYGFDPTVDLPEMWSATPFALKFECMS